MIRSEVADTWDPERRCHINPCGARASSSTEERENRGLIALSGQDVDPFIVDFIDVFITRENGINAPDFTIALAPAAYIISVTAHSASKII
jgi:hypothetical protein